MQWIDAAAIDQLFDYPTLCEALARAHRTSPPITSTFHLQHPGSAESFMLRPAWSKHQMLGVKLATTFPDNRDLTPSRPSIQGLYVAFDGATGAPSFMADGATLTAWKTAADSALGLDLLAPPNVETMLMIGAGEMAGHLINAFTALRPSIRNIAIWNRTTSRASELADRLNLERVGVRVVDDLKKEIPKAQIICSATMSDQPLILGARVTPGTHVSLVGSWLPHMREVDDALIATAQIYVDYRPTALASGELHIPIQNRVITPDDVLGDLFDLCRSTTDRPSANRTTIYKNAGGGHLDLYTAQHLAALANRQDPPEKFKR